MFIFYFSFFFRYLSYILCIVALSLCCYCNFLHYTYALNVVVVYTSLSLHLFSLLAIVVVAVLLFSQCFFMPFDRFVNFVDIVVVGIEIALELQKASNSGLQCFGHFARIYYFCLWCGKCICVLQGFDYKEKHSIYLTHILV